VVQATAIMALLQPSPEVFQLFDDVMLLSDGMCVYFGPREGILPFFENQGFRCPPRMPVPGFLQNITSRRDQKVGRSYQLMLHCMPSLSKVLSRLCSPINPLAPDVTEDMPSQSPSYNTNTCLTEKRENGCFTIVLTESSPPSTYKNTSWSQQ